MKRIIIGTAGHIDHGKTALVKAMTGVDTDRLKEEKKRGISIELGFAPLRLPQGQLAGLVDVPGHERFIRQMLAGAFGFDLVLLVVAADEGIMPQTREHLEIIQLLGISQGIVVITKKDLVDEEWLMMVEEDVREFLQGTELTNWPVITVSAYTRENIDKLLHLIEEMASQVQEKKSVGQIRLPVDRVFTITGFGTVVTGTLWSGRIRVNDILQVLPQDLTVRVRTLQVHNQKVEEALAGNRVAVNLQGIEVADLKRGNVLVTPGSMSPSYRVNASLRLLKSSPRPLKNWTRIRFHLGTDEAFGRVVLLEHDELLPGDQGYVQIALETPVVSAKNDRFVVRFYSPVSTIGGGTIIDPHPPRQKRFNEEVLQQIAIQEEGSLEEVVLHELEKKPTRIWSIEELAPVVNWEEDEIKAVLTELISQEMVDYLQVESKDLYLSRIGLQQIGEVTIKALQEYHKRYPLRRGLSREELRSRYFKEYPTRLFGAIVSLLEERGIVTANATQVSIFGWSPVFDRETEQTVKEVMFNLEKEPFSPPGLKELQTTIQKLGQDPIELMAYLEEEGYVVKVGEGLYFAKTALLTARERLEEHFARQAELSLGEARDMWGTSRRYALPLLEYFDHQKFTKRMGDNRIKIEK